MDKYFSGNAFKFLIFFNLLTFNKRVLNLAGSLARSESHLLCVVIGCSPVMSHSCAHAPLTQDQAWVDRESWWSASWYQQSQIGVVWFCQLKTYPITLSLFIYHHGTGPGVWMYYWIANSNDSIRNRLIQERITALLLWETHECSAPAFFETEKSRQFCV